VRGTWDKISKLVREEVVETVAFEYTIILCILVNCIFLAMDNPDKSGDLQDAINYDIEIVFTVIYTIEMILKWIAWGWFGLYQAPKEDENLEDADEPMYLFEATDSLHSATTRTRQTFCNQLRQKLWCLSEAEVRKSATFFVVRFFLSYFRKQSNLADEKKTSQQTKNSTK